MLRRDDPSGDYLDYVLHPRGHHAGGLEQLVNSRNRFRSLSGQPGTNEADRLVYDQLARRQERRRRELVGRPQPNPYISPSFLAGSEIALLE